MILPTTGPDKSLRTARPKDPELESPQAEPSRDAAELQRAMAHLHESGWYWGPLTAAQAKHLLTDRPEGTFLLRDSSFPGFLLTLSVTTSLGPTHLRIGYARGLFGFDSVTLARPRLRRFEGAVDLVQHYALTHSRHPAGRHDDGEGGHGEGHGGVNPAALAPPASTDCSSLQLKLTRPLPKAPPGLQHLCRVAINRCSRSHRLLPLPGRLKDFLSEYPFVL